MAAYRSADAAFKQAAAVKGAAMSPAETVQASIQIAKSKVRLEQTRSQAKFACIVLGRECIKHGYVPKPVAGQAREVEALRNQYVV